jgi:amino acid transporter
MNTPSPKDDPTSSLRADSTGPATSSEPPAPADRVSVDAGPVEKLVIASTGDEEVVIEAGQMPLSAEHTLTDRVKTLLIGKPRDLADQSIFKHMSLVAFLAWVGLGADGLSSSCYGPAEAFGALSTHRYLAFFLAIAIIATVWIISTCYSHIIEEFPSGGGGYLVASKLLGPRIGVVSGCALLVDYVLTITTSIAAAGDALGGLMPHLQPYLLPLEFGLIVLLIVLNLRGVKESIQLLLPIFLIFLVTHVLIIAGSIGLHAMSFNTVAADNLQQFQAELNNPKFGIWHMLTLLFFAYSLGAGTYTGLEAVSNSMTVLREPRVATAKRTMRYMAISLSLVAGGLIVAYLLLGINHSISPTMNQLLGEQLLSDIHLKGTWLGDAFLWTTLLSASAILVVAAQAGFIDGPRVLANMAHDSWVPRWFSSLSERLATHNGILLMGLSALAALIYTRGNIQTLLVMYSINVFVTFSLSMFGMCRKDAAWKKRLALFSVGAALCVSILSVSVYEKFTVGGDVTVMVTLSCVAICFLIHRYYAKVGQRLKKLDETLSRINADGEPVQAEPDPRQPAAVVLVGGYSGLGIHTMLSAIRFTPGYYKSFIFISTGVLDMGVFKGGGMVDSLQAYVQDSLEKYVELSQRLGMPAKSYMSLGTDAVDELEKICLVVAQEFPQSTFFAGQLVFQKDNWLHRFLHNQTAISLQRRLQWAGYPIVILPTRVR